MEHGAGGGGHQIGAHQLAHFAGLTFNMDTLMMTWLAMAIVIIIAVLATRRIEMVPRGWQNALELAVSALLGQIEDNIGPKGKKVAPLIITLFLFLLVSNWLGLVPGFTSPTNDMNTTLGLALLVVTLVHILGMINRGPVKYLKHFFEPYIPFVFINMLEEVAKPVTLAFRLFGNIFAGEVLLFVLGILVPWVVPTAWLAFSVCVGVIQAFIFTMLSIAYLSNALNDEQH